MKTADALLEGNSVILRAPTGSGKSEAVFVPFLLSNKFPKQMIYSLPLRTLVDDISLRFERYILSNNLDKRVVGHHGKRMESPLFYSDIIITTIDQTVGAYACTPLNLPIRHGNIPAGAVSSAFLVFDEVHTFHPLLGLQAAIILAEHSHKLGLPFVFMSATMPDSFVNRLAQTYDLKVVEAKEENIATRKDREVRVYTRLDEYLSAEKIIEIYNAYKKIIVVCNTVSKAQELKEKIENKVDCKPILLHSRFLEEDRAIKEKELKRLFNKENKEKGILIATQVIEVGLDITCDAMISELAPVDALIQRAGRCARKGGKANFYIYDIEHYAPYDKDLIEATRNKIERMDGQKLDWETEKWLVNEILGSRFIEFMKPEHGAKILNKLSEGAFIGNKGLVEKSVRDVLSCEVSIHNDPSSLGQNIFRLQKINLSLGLLTKYVRDSQLKIWQVDVSDDEDFPRPIIKIAEYIKPYGFYIIHPEYAKYGSDIGLVLKEGGEPFKVIDSKIKEKMISDKKKESWLSHANNTLNVFEDNILPYYDYALEKVAASWGLSKNNLIERIKFAIVLHDIGKLNKKWQKGIGASGEILAHSDKNINMPLPPHATISAYVLSDIFYNWGTIGDAFRFAIAHHHSVRAKYVPDYELVSGWQNEIKKAVELSNINIELNIDNKFSKQLSSTSLDQFPLLKKDKFYRTYCILSRIIRLSDRIATSGDENAILKYEEWYGG